MFAISKEQYLHQMFYEWDNQLREGLYHDTQILMAYNSNRMEGNPLTEHDTLTIFETNMTGYHTPDEQALVNHFLSFNFVLSTIDENLTPEYVKELHFLLMQDTKDSEEADFVLGDWRKSEAWLGAKPTCDYRYISDNMNVLLSQYQNSAVSFESICNFHGDFENIHPFSNGNGRVGRLLHYKECVKHDLTPCIIFDNDKEVYYNGLENLLLTKLFCKMRFHTTREYMRTLS